MNLVVEFNFSGVVLNSLFLESKPAMESSHNVWINIGSIILKVLVYSLLDTH